MYPSALNPQPGAGRNPNALRLSIGINATEQPVGVANKGSYGIGIRPSTRYQVSFFAKADAALGGRLTVGRESTSGTGCATATVSGIGASWAKYTTTLTTGTNAPVSTANRFVIYADGQATGRTLWFTVVQGVGPTFAATGNIRADLERKLADTRPGFLRVLGGDYFEGAVLANRFAWKDTIGPLQDRPGHQNDTWGHWSTDHFGLLNYLQTAEQAGAEPLLAVFARDLPSAPSSRRPTQTTPTADRLGTGVRRPALGTRRLSRAHPCGQHPASMRSAPRVRCGSRRPMPAWHLSTERTRAPPPDGGPAVAGRATGSPPAQAGSRQERLPVPRVGHVCRDLKLFSVPNGARQDQRRPRRSVLQASVKLHVIAPSAGFSAKPGSTRSADRR